jgi:hypothetical protein
MMMTGKTVGAGKKKKSVSKLKKEADDIYSLYIRQRYADPHTGMATCVTCQVSKPWKEQHCGHYETRGTNSLRFDERNGHVQCVGCNIFKKGNYPTYARFMLQTYGPTILEDLARDAKVIRQFKPHDLEEIIDTYKAKLSTLTKR